VISRPKLQHLGPLADLTELLQQRRGGQATSGGASGFGQQ
jgi:hypothetical protein